MLRFVLLCCAVQGFAMLHFYVLFCAVLCCAASITFALNQVQAIASQAIILCRTLQNSAFPACFRQVLWQLRGDDPQCFSPAQLPAEWVKAQLAGLSYPPGSAG